jgi:hypothetical protein
MIITALIENTQTDHKNGQSVLGGKLQFLQAGNIIRI